MLAVSGSICRMRDRRKKHREPQPGQTKDRRKNPRGHDVISRIEDMTYHVLRQHGREHTHKDPHGRRG
jgi:hypothetical protein